MSCALILCALATASTPVKDALTREHLELMLDSDEALILRVFERHSEHVLSFIDRYLEDGFHLLESGRPAQDARTTFRTAIRFAKLADQAFDPAKQYGNSFTRYAEHAASWSPQELQRVREGRRAYEAGQAIKDDPARVLKSYETAWHLASQMRDEKCAALAATAVAECRLQLRHDDEALQAAQAADRTCSALRLRVPGIRAELVCGQVYARQANYKNAVSVLRSAWSALRESDAIELREQVYRAYRDALEKNGDLEAAASLHEQFQTDDATPPRPQ
jgi:hypothetical protein